MSISELQLLFTKCRYNGLEQCVTTFCFVDSVFSENGQFHQKFFLTTCCDKILPYKQKVVLSLVFVWLTPDFNGIKLSFFFKNFVSQLFEIEYTFYNYRLYMIFFFYGLQSFGNKIYILYFIYCKRLNYNST